MRASTSFGLSALLAVALAPTANGAVMIATERYDTGAPPGADDGFFDDFATVPVNVVGDLGASATVTSTELKGNSGPLSNLTDGPAQTTDQGNISLGATFEDNFDGANNNLVVGQVFFDFGGLYSIEQFNAYSWHESTRAPQVYDLYGAVSPQDFSSHVGTLDFIADPTTEGWSLIGSVDTESLGNGGQHGSSITDDTGSLGDYAYLLMQVRDSAFFTDRFVGTNYGEVDVIGTRVPEPGALALLGVAILGGLRRRA